jgi:pimeloyl-ACP methyl ester carboxylesterase
MIALQLAVDAPEMVKSLVVVNAYFEGIIRTFKERIEVWRRTLVVKLMGMRKLGQLLGKRLFPEPGQEQLRQMFIDRWAENNKQAYVSSFQAIIGWSVADKLNTINCPTLIIASDQDYVPLSDKEAYVSEIQNAELVVITDSRHATSVDQPERFNTVLKEFLSKNF